MIGWIYSNQHTKVIWKLRCENEPYDDGRDN